jgi:hypothetical protein
VPQRSYLIIAIWDAAEGIQSSPAEGVKSFVECVQRIAVVVHRVTLIDVSGERSPAAVKARSRLAGQQHEEQSTC